MTDHTAPITIYGASDDLVEIDGAMTNLPPERRAELRGLAESVQPVIRYGGTGPAAVYVPAADLAALLDAADDRDRLAGNRREPRDLDWDRSVDSYHAAGWDDEPGDYERMFFESGWRSAIRALDGADS